MYPPVGNITYLSKVYGGQVTDSIIFEQSSLIKLLEPGDGVILDRGFWIDEFFGKNEWKCIRPPFLRQKKKTIYQGRISFNCKNSCSSCPHWEIQSKDQSI